jgi:hypothetical protein
MQETQIGGVQFKVIEKGGEILSQKTSQAWWYTPVISTTREAEVGGSWSEAGPQAKA